MNFERFHFQRFTKYGVLSYLFQILVGVTALKSVFDWVGIIQIMLA